ncbi:hypothetical protein [Flavobacterium caeni]|uniref:DUF1574 domain-containing protein n=1 Tax=Flavobacterium caeni TaxID=490189 RepID=A0A1G5CQY8_9FLAO|nr:hypothetical protein [Flavobacterium caeni]SCY04691.1 hypothetical protein SAMN02927903_00613 [Flavobacterium caeni]
MKKFLFRIALFFVPIVFVAYAIDIFLSENLKQSNSFANKEYTIWNGLIDGTIDEPILIYGSSRAWVHFDSQMIEDSLGLGTYNLGIDGHNFRMQYLRHRLATTNTKPKLIVLSVDDLSLFTRPDLYNAEQFLPYLLWNTEIWSRIHHYNGFSSYDYLLPLVRYYGQLDAVKEVIRLKRTPEKNPVIRLKGYQGRDAQWLGDLNKVKPFAAPVGELADLFTQFLKECQAADIKVILVYSPQYIEGQYLVTNRKEIFKFYRDCSRRFHIPFFDYSNHPLSMDRDNFYNAMHLNLKGSRLFTQDLIQKLKREPSISTILQN